VLAHIGRREGSQTDKIVFGFAATAAGGGGGTAGGFG
jgi:hypothetical protein